MGWHCLGVRMMVPIHHWSVVFTLMPVWWRRGQWSLIMLGMIRSVVRCWRSSFILCCVPGTTFFPRHAQTHPSILYRMLWLLSTPLSNDLQKWKSFRVRFPFHYPSSKPFPNLPNLSEWSWKSPTRETSNTRQQEHDRYGHERTSFVQLREYANSWSTL
jgi:hypothetical protein